MEKESQRNMMSWLLVTSAPIAAVSDSLSMWAKWDVAEKPF